MLKVLSSILCDLDPKVKAIGQKAGICDGVPSTSALVVFGMDITQVNRMSRSRRVLAIGGKQRILRLDMVCIETILFHLDSL